MKKFLALVLALVMTMSLVTISAGAEDFTDDSKITYEEAVDVMSAVGVVGGYADGSFNPTGSLTRGAAAKIICNMILGPTTAEALAANNAPYKDVPADHVFAGYIAYCANEGIISGYADGTFRPAGTLTGYAFMKMLLGALGYDADVEGYTGSNWSVQVAKRALNLGLDDGLEGSFVGTKALTREEACLYAFNAMNTELVEYENSSTIVVGDITIKNNSVAKPVKDDYLFRHEFFEKLKKDKEDVVDDFGRPAHTWVYDKEDIGTYTDSADYVVVLDEDYVKADEEKTIKAVLDYVLDETDDDLKVDGTGKNATTTWYNGSKKNIDDCWKNAKAGAVIELFVNDDEYVTTVVAYTYKLVEIESVSEKISATAEKKGAEYAINLKGEGTKYDAYDKDPGKVLPGFDAETYTKGTKIAIVDNEVDNEIIASYVAETVTGKISSKGSTYAKIDGTKYVCAGDYTMPTIDFDEEYTLYLTADSYMLECSGDTSVSISDVYYVNGVYTDTTNKGATSYYAEVVSLEGEASDVVISKATYEALDDSESNTKFDYVGELYTLTLNKDDEYEIPENDADNTFDADDGNDDYDVEKGDLEDDVKASASSLNNGVKSYVDEDTQYISVKLKADKGVVKEVKTAVGGMSMVKSVETFTITEDGKKDALYVIYVGADVSATVDTGDVVFVEAESSENDSKDTFLTSVWFMEDVTDDVVSVEAAKGEDVGFYTYAINDDGNYELKDLDPKTGKVDEDWSGWTFVMFKKAGIHDETLTYENAAKTTTLEDIDFSSATVIDLRDEDDVDAGEYKYDRTITSVSDLVDAAEETDVRAYVYISDGVITFAAVTHDYN